LFITVYKSFAEGEQMGFLIGGLLARMTLLLLLLLAVVCLGL
jgi:hypothetical protein